MSYLRYAVIGKDSEYSFAPVDLGESGFILCDGLYDICDTPYNEEMCRLAMPQVFKDFMRAPYGYGEYWNPVTGLLVEYQPGEEGYEPLTKPGQFAARDPKAAPFVTSCRGAGFSLDRVIEFVGFNKPAVLVTDCEQYWSANTLNDVLTWDDCQNRAFKLVEIDITEANEFFEV